MDTVSCERPFTRLSALACKGLLRKMTTVAVRKSLVQSTHSASGPNPSRCGYCKSPNTFLVEAVWAFRMTCQDYQELVDRGFQRSGKYVYRPIMKETCCPQYVIRTDVTKFKPSKSQRYAMRKLRRFLLEGKPAPIEQAGVSEINSLTSPTPLVSESSANTDCEACMDHQQMPSSSNPPDSSQERGTQLESQKPPSVKKKEVKPGLGPDPTKPPARKAKIIRRERRKNKTLADSVSMSSSQSSLHISQTVEYPLDELVSLPDPNDCKHKFETRLVPVNPASQTYRDTFQESMELFIKFQRTIHKEKEEDCTMSNFKEFIEHTPLIATEGVEGMPCGYGTYHQHYLIDGTLFAVGVLDILPRGVLCEYLYYDPDYRFLAPGVYSAIREIALTQQCYQACSSMQYYYMGFYVQSCPKMNYKSQYNASYLLCPETHTYVPLQLCVPKLIASGYARLAEESVPNVQEEISEEELDNFPVFSLLHATEQPECRNMTYGQFRAKFGDAKRLTVKEYARLVGLKVAMEMKLYLSFF